MSQGRPRIGLSMDTGQPDENRKTYELAADYADAILAAGGLPVLLPQTTDPNLIGDMLSGVTGLVIPGGADLDASLWGEPQHPKSKKMDPGRQAFDLALLNRAQEMDLPTLGICLGCQMMNVSRGGSLHQSIVDAFPESTVTHARVRDPENYNSSFHNISIRPGTRVAEIFAADDINTNSRHRQAINRLGRGFVASAFAPDGILEALEDRTRRWWIGVQWHPENLHKSIHGKLFASLVEASRP